MLQVGMRELKNKLSRYLKRVQGGEEIVVTERGRTVARLVPAKASDIKIALETLMREGTVRWSGGKSRGTGPRPRIQGRTLAAMVVEDRQ